MKNANMKNIRKATKKELARMMTKLLGMKWLLTDDGWNKGKMVEYIIRSIEFDNFIYNRSRTMNNNEKKARKATLNALNKKLAF